jgi:hypothetical protein
MDKDNRIVAGSNVNVSNPEQSTAVTPTVARPIEPFFYPQPLRAPSPEYEEFMRVRQKILNVIRNETPEKKKVLDDLVDTLIKYDKDIPTNILSGILAVVGVGKKIHALRKKRELYTKVIASILEQIFDPGLEFKMMKKDILDAFEANDIDRDKVSNQQISLIYVKVIHKLQVGELRDLTHEEQLYRYAQLKFREIKLSRQDWELNGR